MLVNKNIFKQNDEAELPFVSKKLFVDLHKITKFAREIGKSLSGLKIENIFYLDCKISFLAFNFIQITDFLDLIFKFPNKKRFFDEQHRK